MKVGFPLQLISNTSSAARGTEYTFNFTLSVSFSASKDVLMVSQTDRRFIIANMATACCGII